MSADLASADAQALASCKSSVWFSAATGTRSIWQVVCDTAFFTSVADIFVAWFLSPSGNLFCI